MRGKGGGREKEREGRVDEGKEGRREGGGEEKTHEAKPNTIRRGGPDSKKPKRNGRAITVNVAKVFSAIDICSFLFQEAEPANINR